MKNFEYSVAHTVEEAVSLLAEKGDQARPIAGGTDLIVQLRSGRRTVERVVQIKDIPELTSMSLDPSVGLTIGAATECYKIYGKDPILGNFISQAYPGLIDAASMIGSIQIQGRASVGGNLANAAPSGDAICPLIVLNAKAIVAGPNGRREIAAEDFCIGPGRNSLEPGELLVSIVLPMNKPHSSSHYLRFIPRNEMDIAVAGSGVSVVLDASGTTIQEAKIAIASVGPTPIYCKEAGESLAGKEASEANIQNASELAMAAATPITDMRGTVEQRRHLVGVLTRRALNGAIQRAKEA